MVVIKLMKGAQWAKREFIPGSVPCPQTIQKWVERGVVNGRIIDGTAYVFVDQKAGLDSGIQHAVNDLLRG